MRFSELTDQQSAALMKEFVQLRTETLPDLRVPHRQIAAYFVAAGFCVFGCIRAIALGPTMSAAALLFIFALGGSYFFGTAWKKFISQMAMTRAGERAYLALVFEKCANQGIEFTTQDVAHFLRFAPDRTI